MSNIPSMDKFGLKVQNPWVLSRYLHLENKIELAVKSAFLNILTNQVAVNFNVFRSFMRNRVGNYMERRLIITIDVHRCGINDVKSFSI